MSIQILDRIPDVFTLGDTIKFIKSVSDCPFSAGWTLTYYFVKKDGTANIFNVVATQNGTSEDYLITITSAKTSSLTAGEYSWRAKLTKLEETSSIEDGSVILDPSYAVAVVTLSPACAIVAAIDAAIAGTATLTQKKLKIRDREIEKFDQGGLLQQRTYYAQQCNAEKDAEKLAQGLPNPNTIRTRMPGN